MIQKNGKVYFTDKEICCPCCGAKPTEKLRMRLLELRLKFGVSMKINSCKRCNRHNKKVGGAPSSYHLKGWACDIHCPDSSYKANLAKCALDLGWTVGVYKTFLHLDIREIQIMFRGKY